MPIPPAPSAPPPKPDRPQSGPGVVAPRDAAPDAFEQNPLSGVAERISLQAAEGLDDAGRVREALSAVIGEGVSITEAARRCHVAPSSLLQWREKYFELLNETPSVASRPLVDKGAMLKNADLVTIPRVAREQFSENWEHLVEVTRATPSAFRQNPVAVFLENSWLTSWLYTEGRLDRGTFAGAGVALVVLVLTATFLMAGHFYRREDKPRAEVLNYDSVNQRAFAVARQFFSAATAEEKRKFVRLTDDTRPLFDRYFQQHPAESLPGVTLTQAIPGSGMVLLECHIPSLRRQHQCVVVEQDSQMLLDWETASWFQEANLTELRKTRPHTPVRIAVRVAGDTYYNYGFTEADWVSFRLIYPGFDHDLYGYARRDTPEQKTLTALLTPFTSVERPVSALLQVRYPEDPDAPVNQVEIVSILSEDWVMR